MQQKKLAFYLSSLFVAASLVGCSSDQMLLQSKVDYRGGSDNVSRNPLEVPPDLSAVTTNSNYSIPKSAVLANEAQQQKSTGTVLPEYQNARLVQADGARWLVVKGDPAKTWPEIREFWLSHGFILTQDNETTGVMETDWLENRAALPTDFVTNLIRKVADSVISTGELDKFRTRIERGTEPGTFEIYVTHRGMREVFADGSQESTGGSSQGVQKTIWTPRPSDPELEVEMLKLMLQQFGMSKEQASATVKAPVSQVSRANLSASGNTLEVKDTFDRAWRRVGLAFDRIGYTVEDRNRTEGTFTVQRAAANIGKEQSTEYFSSLAFWRSKETNAQTSMQQYQVKLKPELDRTVISVQAVNGGDQATSKKILQDLLMQLK
ncbi:MULTISPECIES: outer membrane protein assembly factor BamC [Deefgea]|uniref:Outer membrane protein assembly factor BamC n=1 Tax=Deefgea chitinilytica TaxID=570276 RepID=A0ABS2CBD3_9NEIS|nr:MULTISPECIES: outer membrane protein assembly factor BamC [Deefgea]MBM5570758.1 outer membrane protein assembly factor BamC [Deefgea chitinilytica]MBM9887987.1 outer membrane protein assembly factor BamC [Deefgea sp. CFH1-16]